MQGKIGWCTTIHQHYGKSWGSKASKDTFFYADTIIYQAIQAIGVHGRTSQTYTAGKACPPSSKQGHFGTLGGTKEGEMGKLGLRTTDWKHIICNGTTYEWHAHKAHKAHEARPSHSSISPSVSSMGAWELGYELHGGAPEWVGGSWRDKRIPMCKQRQCMLHGNVPSLLMGDVATYFDTKYIQPWLMVPLDKSHNLPNFAASTNFAYIATTCHVG